MDIIRCDDTSSIISKWHSDKGPKQDNAIKLGSSLRVKTGQVAVFLYKKDNDTYQDIIEGPFDQILETKNIPIISNIIGLAYHGGSPFQAEVYFINTLKLIQVRFGVPFFDVYDNTYKEFSVPVAVRGTINLHVKDVNEFIQIFGLRDLSIEDFQKMILSKVTRYVKYTITNIPETGNLSPLKLETKISDVSDILEIILKEKLSTEFGVEVTSLDVDGIEVDKKSDDYNELIKVGKKLTLSSILHKVRIKKANDTIEVVKSVTDIAMEILEKLKQLVK